jgi:hypothetical protein
MEPAGAIGKLGFQRWYERELLICHSWLVACLLCAFALLALLEDLNVREAGWAAVPAALAAFAAGCVAWYALARYLGMLFRALHVAERSTCTRCGAHGKYRLVSATARSMTVHCRRCDSEWSID